MTRNPLASLILDSAAGAYAAYAVNLLLERRPEAEERFAPAAFRGWKSHLTQRVLEVAAALEAGEPELFVARVDWARKAFGAREVPEDDLRAGLECLRDVLREELPENARDDAGAVIDRGLAAFARPAPDDAGLDPTRPNERLALEYLMAVLEGDGRRAAEVVVGAVDGGLAIEEAYLDVLLAAQREVGRMWQDDEASVAEEHFVTTTTQRVMSILSQRATPAAPNGKTVVAAAVAGNRHDVGIRAVADFFEMAGWRAVSLGADVPAADVAAAVQFFDADLVVLSATLATQLKALREAIESVRAVSDGKAKVLVGGLAFADAEDLWRLFGVNGHAATADAAVELGARLLGIAGRDDRAGG